MNDNLKQQIDPSVFTDEYKERADEMASTVNALIESWVALPDDDKLNTIKMLRRNLIDMAASP